MFINAHTNAPLQWCLRLPPVSKSHQRFSTPHSFPSSVPVPTGPISFFPNLPTLSAGLVASLHHPESPEVLTDAAAAVQWAQPSTVKQSGETVMDIAVQQTIWTLDLTPNFVGQYVTMSHTQKHTIIIRIRSGYMGSVSVLVCSCRLSKNNSTGWTHLGSAYLGFFWFLGINSLTKLFRCQLKLRHVRSESRSLILNSVQTFLQSALLRVHTRGRKSTISPQKSGLHTDWCIKDQTYFNIMDLKSFISFLRGWKNTQREKL